jgi:hypothetical protein
VLTCLCEVIREILVLLYGSGLQHTVLSVTANSSPTFFYTEFIDLLADYCFTVQCSLFTSDGTLNKETYPLNIVFIHLERHRLRPLISRLRPPTSDLPPHRFIPILDGICLILSHRIQHQLHLRILIILFWTGDRK